MHAVRSCVAVVTTGVLLLVTGVVIGGPAHADTWYPESTTDGVPHPVQVTSEHGHALVSWAVPEAADVVGYRAYVQDHESGRLVADYDVADGALSLDLVDLPRWDMLRVFITSIHEGPEARESMLGWSDTFRVLSTLSLANDTPIVLHGDGCCWRTYEIRRTIRLDAPMPVDVYLRGKELSFDGRPAKGDPDPPSYPAQIDDLPIRIPAGETTATYSIYHWGNDWKRFEYGHWVFGFENYADYRPAGYPPPYIEPGSGLVEFDISGQQLTIFEDDKYFWPEALMLAQQSVRAGRTARVRVKLNSPAARRTQITYRLQEGTAHAGRDYLGKRGVIVIPRGARAGWIRVPTRAVPDAHRSHRSSARLFKVRITAAKKQLARIGSRASTTVRITR